MRGEMAESCARLELVLRKTESDADASRNKASRVANDHVAAQEELRRVEAQRSDEADAFCREILELSGIGTGGSLTKKEASEGSHWEAFTVLEDPPTDLYFLVNDEDPNAGERSRIALQETMFTEFPKYWDRTRETRDRLNLATLNLASTLRAKRETEEAASLYHGKIRDSRERWYASREALQRVETALSEMLELEESLERCAGGEGLAGRIQRIELRLEVLELRFTEAGSEFDRTREEIAVMAPPGYREESEEHLEAAWGLLQQIAARSQAVRRSLRRALHSFAEEERDQAREHATRSQRACDDIEEQLQDVSKFFDQARFSASEGQASYFQDGPDVRSRNAVLSRMDLDYALMISLRDASDLDELDHTWSELELWSSLPGWLSAYEDRGLSRVPEEAYEGVRNLLGFLQETHRPCEPKARGARLLKSFIEGGYARTEQEAYLLFGELCGLMRRLSAMIAEG